jgi:tetratricopeptide (TPR) repeat protein
MTGLCSDALLQALIQDIQAGAGDQLERVSTLLAEFPDDGRLHFLYGSQLVQAGRLIEGHNSLKQAVALAPDFAIARFQLGLFQLTSGEAANALDTFGRLDALPDGHYLRRFADGLRCLIRDDFRGAISQLQEGIRLNSENLPLNRDMGLVIQQCEPLASGPSLAEDETTVSETSLVLRQFSGRRTLN